MPPVGFTPEHAAQMGYPPNAGIPMHFQPPGGLPMPGWIPPPNAAFEGNALAMPPPDLAGFPQGKHV